MHTRTPSRGRLAELLAGEAMGDLDRAERAELDELLRAAPAANRDEFRQIAALTRRALSGRTVAGLPARVRDGLRQQARSWSARRQAGDDA